MLASDQVMDRHREIAWTRAHLVDLEADFRAWYGVTDMLSMPGPEFFRLALRTVAFQGVMAARAQGVIDAQGAEARAVVEERPTPAAGRGEVPGDRASIEASDVLGGLIDWEG